VRQSVTPKRAGPGTALARTLVRVGALCGLAACVTTYEDTPFFASRSERPPDPPRPAYAVPVTIPIQGQVSDPDQALVAEFYQNVLQRLHEAMKEGDLPQLEALLANYERADLPPALLERVRAYRELAQGLRFCREAAARTKLVVLLPKADAPDAPPVEAGAPALGAPLHLELQLPAG